MDQLGHTDPGFTLGGISARSAPGAERGSDWLSWLKGHSDGPSLCASLKGGATIS